MARLNSIYALKVAKNHLHNAVDVLRDTTPTDRERIVLKKVIDQCGAELFALAELAEGRPLTPNRIVNQLSLGV